MLATPVSAIDVAVGHLLWVGVRIAAAAAAMVAVVAAFGGVSSLWGLLAIPAAVLTGLALPGRRPPTPSVCGAAPGWLGSTGSS